MSSDDRELTQGSEPAPGSTPRVVQREIRSFVRAHKARREQFPRAMLVGLLAGGVAVLFRWVLFLSDNARDALLPRLHRFPLWGWLVLPILGFVTGSVAGWLTRRYAPEATGSGIPHVKAVLLHLRSLRWQRVLPVKFFAGLIGIGGGLSMGREGPTIQMGAAVGQAVSEFLRVSPESLANLIVEMTEGYQQMLMLLVACLAAYAVADVLGDRPIYEALLERDLDRGQDPTALEETTLLEVPVDAGSPLEGRWVSELHLPPGCLLVSVRRGAEEFVPHANTALQAGDHLTLAVAPEAAAAVHLLRSAGQAGGTGAAGLFHAPESL